MPTLDLTDIKILQILQQDSKVTIKEIAESLHLSTTPIFDRIKKLEKSGIIKNYVALVDAPSIGCRLTVLVDITIKDHTLDGIEDFVNYIIAFPEVIECHHVTGDSDIYIKLVLEDMESYNQFVLTKLSVAPNVGHVMSRFSLSTRKNTTIIPLAEKSQNLS